MDRIDRDLGAVPPPPTVEPEPPLLPWRQLSVLVPVAVLALVLSVVRLPYFVVSPGPADDVLPRIQIEGTQTYPVRGHLLLTSVIVQQANAYQALRGWLDDSQAVLPSSAILAPGESPQEQVQRSLSEMDTSRIDAAIVALTRYADYPEEHGKGVLVEQVVSGTPAEGKLFAGDLILSVDGEQIRDVDQLSELLAGAEPGRPVSFHIQVQTEEGTTEMHDVSVAPVTVPNVDHPIVGIVVVDNFPFRVSIKTGNIGGPSAGLMWTLGLVDLLTPGDMTGGRIIAGTGTISPDGSVGPIGGIGEKVIAAERAGAKIFFAPVQDAPDARAAARAIVVVPVTTYQDAVRYLETHP